MKMRIEKYEIGAARTYVIAEIGNNHNGSLDTAKRLIDEAIAAGADCVKFQLRNREALYRQLKRVQVEPHLSVTGACSAEWVPIKPKTDPAATGKSAGGIELSGKAAMVEDPQSQLVSQYRRKLSMALN